MSMGGGGGGDPGRVNREREQRGIQLANEAFGKSMGAIKSYVDKSIAAAKNVVTQEQERSTDYRSLIESANADYSRTMQDAIASFEGALPALYEQERGFIDDYKARSEGIVTRSGQEAVDFNLKNADNFISFADTLTESAFRTRQSMIDRANPYQLAQQEQISRNNLEMLQGRLPADVMAAMQRQSAYGALQGGFGAGSQAGSALAARNLGLTSLDLAMRADQSAQNWAKLIYDTQVSGLQTTAAQASDYMGISTKDALTINQRNNENLLGAQQSYVRNQQTGLNTILGARQAVGRDVFVSQSDMGKTRYLGGLDAVLKSGAMQTSAYYSASRQSVAAASAWGDWRQSVNNTAWQNQLQEEADKTRRAAAGLSSIASLGGAVVGGLVGTFVAPGLGTAAGASLGASLGGSLGGAAGGGGGGDYSRSFSAPQSRFNVNDLLGFGSSLGSMVTGGLDRNSGFYGSATGAAKAFNVDPSYISRQGIGQYYYSPAGVYGRGDMSRSFV